MLQLRTPKTEEGTGTRFPSPLSVLLEFDDAGRRDHGSENAMGMHAGDLPNITVPAGGKLTFDFFAPEVTLKAGPTSLMDADGTAIVLHATADDYKGDPAGNAGARIACGVVTK